jgi:hypothetical protein
MTGRVWLHEARGNESGCNAWVLDSPGLATHASSEQAVLARLPGKAQEYSLWLRSHSIAQPPHHASYRILERVTGDEILFSLDREPATDQEIDTTLRLLGCSRYDLVTALRHLPETAFDWDPPYEDFASWASWRTIRQIIAHIANTENHYYLPTIGHRPSAPPALPEDDWQVYLPAHRLEVVRFLRELRLTDDRVRLMDISDDQWSVRKVLRRLVRHELLHWKSIKRIAHEFRLRSDPG